MPTTNTKTSASQESTPLAETLRRVGSNTVRVLVVATLVVVGLSGTGLADEMPAADGGNGDQGVTVVAATSDTVTVHCSGFAVDVPDDKEYYLTVTVLDEASGHEFRASGGPFTGPIDERFGNTDLTVTAVELMYEGSGGASDSMTERC
ncbi:hypothetical protein ACFQH6_06625 [Halobacteriaceae archaeon GCM10025711]